MEDEVEEIYCNKCLNVYFNTFNECPFCEETINNNNMYNTEQEIQDRIDAIDKEAKEIRDLKASNKVSSEDIEDLSDNYQYNLEWTYLLRELQEERDFLVQERDKFHLVEADYWDGDESDRFAQ